jgi:hypothetical protein
MSLKILQLFQKKCLAILDDTVFEPLYQDGKFVCKYVFESLESF